MPILVWRCQENQINPLLAFGVMGIGSIILLRYTKETFHLHIQEHLEESLLKKGTISNKKSLRFSQASSYE